MSDNALGTRGKKINRRYVEMKIPFTIKTTSTITKHNNTNKKGVGSI